MAEFLKQAVKLGHETTIFGFSTSKCIHLPPFTLLHWAPRTRKRHQQEHRPQRPTERNDPTQHAKGRRGDCPGPRKGATTGRKVTQGVQRPKKKACGPKIGLKFPAPLINFIFLTEENVSELEGGGWVGRELARAPNNPPPPSGVLKRWPVVVVVLSLLLSLWLWSVLLLPRCALVRCASMASAVQWGTRKQVPSEWTQWDPAERDECRRRGTSETPQPSLPAVCGEAR